MALLSYFFFGPPIIPAYAMNVSLLINAAKPNGAGSD